MTAVDAGAARQSATTLAAAAPRPRVESDARSHIRAANAAAKVWIIVLDDDPTGTQSVHQIPVLTSWEADDLRWAFDQPATGFFVLTNTRGLNDDEATATIVDIAAVISQVAAERGVDYTLITRSDSTLRGHYPLETDILVGMAREEGRPYDALLLVPAYIAAGRVTSSDVHYVQAGEEFVPVADTDYARDATFGFANSNLRDYVAEKTAGAIIARDVVSIGLDDIRLGGPERVRDLLVSCSDAVPVVVNALADSDLDIVALGLLLAEEAGTRVLCRTGPSFVASRLGMVSRGPLTHAEIFASGERAGHGLVIVGSHVELTTRQVSRLTADVAGLETIVLDVPSLLDPALAVAEVDRCAAALIDALARADTLLVSSRQQVIGDSGHSSLLIAQAVSGALVELSTRAVNTVPLTWVLAKGGITSSDIATDGIGIQRATVAGQLFTGIVSVWLNEADDHELAGLPYVVFAGNVGDESTLADAVAILQGRAPIRA
jgi:uncharacterized protein YgbK (DUF1537 family)